MQPASSQICLFCGHAVQLVHVHGHYQCPLCHTNALPCCDGDNCDTNLLLQETGTGFYDQRLQNSNAEVQHTPAHNTVTITVAGTGPGS